MAKKRTNGDGNIRKRSDGRWEGRYTAGYDPAAGKRLIKNVLGKTQAEVKEKLKKVEMQVLSLENIKAYLDAAAKRDALPMFYLELVSGLRKGELVALLWSDVDPERKTISVSKQYVRSPNGECVLSRPKTENSVRLVSVSQEAIGQMLSGGLCSSRLISPCGSACGSNGFYRSNSVPL